MVLSRQIDKDEIKRYCVIGWLILGTASKLADTLIT